jgi:hypothetical protein
VSEPIVEEEASPRCHCGGEHGCRHATRRPGVAMVEGEREEGKIAEGSSCPCRTNIAGVNDIDAKARLGLANVLDEAPGNTKDLNAIAPYFIAVAVPTIMACNSDMLVLPKLLDNSLYVLEEAAFNSESTIITDCSTVFISTE